MLQSFEYLSYPTRWQTSWRETLYFCHYDAWDFYQKLLLCWSSLFFVDEKMWNHYLPRKQLVVRGITREQLGEAPPSGDSKLRKQICIAKRPGRAGGPNPY